MVIVYMVFNSIVIVLHWRHAMLTSWRIEQQIKKEPFIESIFDVAVTDIVEIHFELLDIFVMVRDEDLVIKFHIFNIDF